MRLHVFRVGLHLLVLVLVVVFIYAFSVKRSGVVLEECTVDGQQGILLAIVCQSLVYRDCECVFRSRTKGGQQILCVSGYSTSTAAQADRPGVSGRRGHMNLEIGQSCAKRSKLDLKDFVLRF